MRLEAVARRAPDFYNALEKLDDYLEQNPLAPDRDQIKTERTKVARNLK